MFQLVTVLADHLSDRERPRPGLGEWWGAGGRGKDGAVQYADTGHKVPPLDLAALRPRCGFLHSLSATTYTSVSIVWPRLCMTDLQVEVSFHREKTKNKLVCLIPCACIFYLTRGNKELLID